MKYDLTAFEETIPTLHEDLSRTKPTGERHVELALRFFEDKLATLN